MKKHPQEAVILKIERQREKESLARSPWKLFQAISIFDFLPTWGSPCSLSSSPITGIDTHQITSFQIPSELATEEI